MNNSNRIFFTGVPGSRWSGIAQILETIPGFNTSDRTPEREYSHKGFTGHRGAYFGQSMEFPAVLDLSMIDNAWEYPVEGTKIVKSHEWAFYLDEIYSLNKTTQDRIMLVYRNNDASFRWWKEAGGFSISYPDYSSYINDDNMKKEIAKQNSAIIEFAKKHSLVLESFSGIWVKKNFGVYLDVDGKYSDVFVSLL